MRYKYVVLFYVIKNRQKKRIFVIKYRQIYDFYVIKYG